MHIPSTPKSIILYTCVYDCCLVYLSHWRLKSDMSESQIENYLKREIEKLGGLCLKFVSPGNKGVPDRIIILPNGQIIFAELKTEKGKLSALQVKMQETLNKLNCRALVLNSKPSVDKLVVELRDEL